MILGSVTVTERAVETHRDSYVLDHLTVVSVRRPFFAGGCLFAVGIVGFTAAFADLLYPPEIKLLGAMALICLILGRIVGQIQLLSRDLRGTELSGMIWGSYGHLNRVRREIVAAMEGRRTSRER